MDAGEESAAWSIAYRVPTGKYGDACTWLRVATQYQSRAEAAAAAAARVIERDQRVRTIIRPTAELDAKGLPTAWEPGGKDWPEV